MEARQYYWVTYREWSHHHSLSPPTCQHRQLKNRKAGPSNAWRTELQNRITPRVSLYVPDMPIYRVEPQPGAGGARYVPNVHNREGPQVREPSKCLNGKSYRERLAKEAFWSPATRSLKKDSDRATTPAVEAVHVLHTWWCQGPHNPSRCATFTINPHWG